MARAELHYALVLDREIYEASAVDATLLDPVVRVEGGIPGYASPVVILRDYQGPQGAYTEYCTITDPRGTEVARTHTRRINLSGEMFEDRILTVLTDLRLESAGEHVLHCHVNDIEVGSIPVFLEIGLGGDVKVALEETFKKALSKGSIAWLSVPRATKTTGRGRLRRTTSPEHTQAVWYVLEGTTVYVLNGPTEQQVPGLPDAPEVFITARSKDLRSKVSRVPASVRLVPKDDPRWAKVAATGLGKRLNLPDGDGALERWRSQCELFELTPRFGDEEIAQQGAGAGAGAAAAAETAASPAAAAAAEAPARRPEDEIHVEAQVDQAVYDQLIAEGKSERIARSKAKAAYVRAEKARIMAEREAS